MTTATVRLVYEFEYPEDFTDAEVKVRAVEDFNEAIHSGAWFGEGSLDMELARAVKAGTLQAASVPAPTPTIEDIFEEYLGPLPTV